MNALFKQPLLSLEKPEELLEWIENKLSPENLTCDGEASRSSIQYHSKMLHGLKNLIIPQAQISPKFKSGDKILFQANAYTIIKVKKVNYLIENEQGQKFNLKFSAPIKLI